jgi:hypothetical protein
MGYLERYRNEASQKRLFRWWDFAIVEIEKTAEAKVIFLAQQGYWKYGKWIVASNEFPDLPKTFTTYDEAYAWLEEKMTDYFAKRIYEAKELIQKEQWELCSVSLLQRHMPRCGYAGAAWLLGKLQNQGVVSKQSELERPGFRVLLKPLQKQLRLEKANQLLKVIASCGRRFFAHQGRVSRFELDTGGRVWFVDAYNEARIYTHRTNGRWRGFSEGGTLRSLVIALRDYIQTGEPIPSGYLGPWPDWYCAGDPWGYGESMKLVAEAAGHFIDGLTTTGG